MMIQLLMSAAILMTTFAACPNQQTTAESKAMAATPTPDSAGLPSFTVQDVNGNLINLHSFKGKKVFVNLWASWCPPCRAEMPSIEKLYRSVDTSKVAFVMLALDDTFDKAIRFIKNRKVDLPVYYPAESRLPALFNVQGIPTTFIFNESGTLIQRIDGGDNYNSEHYRKILQ